MVCVTRTHPHSELAPADRKLGLSLARQNDGRILIRKVLATSLFASSAVQPQQELFRVNGKDVRGLPVQQVVELLQKEMTVSIETKTADDYDDIDACQVGQFLLNPLWYLYVKLKNSTNSGRVVDSKVQKMLWMSRLQIFLYLTSFYTVWYLVFTTAIPLVRAKTHVSSFHEVLLCALFAAAVSSWLAATMTSPGSITLESMERFDTYKYDEVLYHKDNICPTSNMRKLARSKFDRYSQKQVPRFDHFCTWLGNTIGEENYRFFIVFCGIHALMVTYGIWLSAALLVGEVRELMHDGHLTFLAATAQRPVLVFGLTFNILASIPTDLFFVFHLSLIGKGMTTNEYYKWQQILKEDTRYTGQSKPLDVERAPHPPPGMTSKKNLHIYNLGWAGNFYEIFFPRSLRVNKRMGYKEL